MPELRSGVRIRIVLASGAALGPGKADLLEAIEALGSIRAAGARFGMSYRRAWELVSELNAMFVEPLVEASAGGRGGGGARLTPLGRRVLALFREIEAKTMVAAEAEIAALSEHLRPAAGHDAP